MNLTCIVFGIIFIVCGVLFAMRKLLPRAWKEMSADEKSKVKIKPLCINVGIMIIICGTIVSIRGFCAAFEGKAFVIAMIAWLILCAADVFYISKSKRYNDK